MIYSIKVVFSYIAISIFVFTSVAYSAFDGNYVFQLESATQVTMENINTPQNGMMIYNSDDNKIYYYDGSSWLTTVSSNIYSTDGNLSSNREVNLNSHNISFTNGNVSIGKITPEATLDVNGSFRLNGVFYDKDGDTGTNGQILVSTVAGVDWADQTLNPVPYILDTLINIPISTTRTITLRGTNFISTSTVSIPGFDGSINSVNIISPLEIEINITTASVAFFDIVVSNAGVLNTQWTGNGVALLQVSNNNGQTPSVAGLTCKSILDDGFSTGDGTYWINPSAGTTADAFQVYCDMTTDGGGWTRIEYAADLTHQKYFPSGADTRRWLDNNFTFTLTDMQINNIRSQSTEGKQTYRGTCDGVLHYMFGADNYIHSFGFRFHDGSDTAPFGLETYAGTNITVIEDGCRTNNGASLDTVFEIIDIRVPVLNVNSRDNGSNSERFGSPLTQYPAWLR